MCVRLYVCMSSILIQITTTKNGLGYRVEVWYDSKAVPVMIFLKIDIRFEVLWDVVFFLKILANFRIMQVIVLKPHTTIIIRSTYRYNISFYYWIWLKSIEVFRFFEILNFSNICRSNSQKLRATELKFGTRMNGIKFIENWLRLKNFRFFFWISQQNNATVTWTFLKGYVTTKLLLWENQIKQHTFSVKKLCETDVETI